MSVPTGESAAKARNYLIKTYGVERFPGWGSNPYSNTQVLEAIIRDRDAGAVIFKDLEEQGWTVKITNDRDKSGDRHFTATHSDGGHITGWSTSGRRTFGKKPFVMFNIYGKKKAKRSTIPYYD